MGVHDLDKYPEVKRLLGIPEDEPIFILRAQDILYRPTLSAYESLYLSALNVTNENTDSVSEDQWKFADDVSDDAEVARKWQRVNSDKVKIPD